MKDVSLRGVGDTPILCFLFAPLLVHPPLPQCGHPRQRPTAPVLNRNRQNCELDGPLLFGSELFQVFCCCDSKLMTLPITSLLCGFP
jgi:hypothetical protein